MRFRLLAGAVLSHCRPEPTWFRTQSTGVTERVNIGPL